MISFLLLTLGFFSSFSRCLKCKVMLFIWCLSCVLRYACIAMNLPLSTAFTEFNRFWVVVFSFSVVYIYIFWLPFLFLPWSVGYSEVHCLTPMCLYFKNFFSCIWQRILPHCDWKRCLKWFQLFWIYQGRFMAQDVIYLGECLCALQKKVNSVVFGWNAL